jgi:hypothetical protein
MKGRTSMKARLGVATAVVVGGGAIGVAAIASNHNNATIQSRESAFSYTMHFRHRMSVGTALSTALSQWGRTQQSHQRAMTTLAQMQTMRNFSQVMVGSRHHRTMDAAQRGTVLFVDKNFMVVKSANGERHLWWLNTNTGFENVSSNGTGMVALSGNNNAGFQAMVNTNLVPAENALAGSAQAAAAAAAPVTKPITFTIQTGTLTITITITPSSATVSTPPATPTGMAPTGTTSATPSMTPTMAPTGTTSATPSMTPTSVTTTQPAITNVNGVVKGDMVMVTGTRVNGRLIAKLVLYTPVTTTTTPTPPASASVSTSTTPATGTTPAVAPSGISGTHS